MLLANYADDSDVKVGAGMAAVGLLSSSPKLTTMESKHTSGSVDYYVNHKTKDGTVVALQDGKSNLINNSVISINSAEGFGGRNE